MSSRSCAIWIGILFAAGLSAQQLPFKAYRIEDGLLQSSVTFILEDSSGYIWFASHAGLSRFDGNEFTNYEMADGLPHPVVRQLILDKEGRLWGGTDDGIFVKQGERFQGFKINNGKLLGVTDLLFDDDGSLLVGTRHGLYRFREGHFEALWEKEALFAESGSLIVRRKDGSLIFGGYQGLATREKGTLKPLLRDQVEASKMLRAMMLDRNDRLWIAKDAAGLLRYDFASGTLTEIEPFRDQAVRIMMEDRHGEVWVGTRDNGVFRFKKDWTNYQIKQGLPSSSVYAIYRDREDSIWFGTYGGGVCRLSNENFFNFNRTDGFLDPNVNHIAEDREGRLWLATNGGLLTGLEEGEIRTLTTRDGLINNKIVTVLPVSDGRLLLGTLAGLSVYDKGKFQNFGNAAGLKNPLILSFAETQKGEIWVGTFSGLAQFKNDRFQYLEACQNYRINSLASDRDEGLWVGTTTGILSYKDGKAQVPDWAQALQKTFVSEVIVDHRGQIWMATSTGVYVWDKLLLRHYGLTDGLNNETCQAIVEDSVGRVWVGTNRGVNFFNGDRFVSFSSKDGMSGCEVNRGAAFQDRQGRIWMGTISGATIFKPEATMRNLMPPRIAIEHWRVNNEPRDLKDGVLSWNQNRVEIRYTGLSFVAADDLLYLFKLEGYDKDWDLRKERSVQYTELSPGRYRFLVKARIGTDLESKEAAVLSFEIATPWWRTLWFRLLLLSLILLIAYALYAWRVVILRRRNKELEWRVKERTLELERRNAEVLQAQKQLVIQERMASLGALTAGVAHEIKNPLNFINNFSEVIEDLSQELTETLDSYEQDSEGELLPTLRGLSQDFSTNAALIQKHGQRASEIIQAMSALAGQSGKAQMTQVSQLLNEMVALVLGGKDSESHVPGLTLKRDYGADLGEISLSARDVGRALVNLLKNSLEALKLRLQWGELFEPKIELKAWREKDCLMISVWDNGIGMPQEIQSKAFTPFFTTKPTGTGHTGLGLSLVYEVVTQHDGEIELHSTLGEYTELVMRLPL